LEGKNPKRIAMGFSENLNFS